MAGNPASQKAGWPPSAANNIEEHRTLELASTRGLRLLANLKDEGLMQAFVDRCSMQLLVQYTRLLEWLFSNGDDGRWLRKLSCRPIR
jgi:hypothetical protein